MEIKFTLAANSIYNENHILDSSSEQITISISGFVASSTI